MELDFEYIVSSLNWLCSNCSTACDISTLYGSYVPAREEGGIKAGQGEGAEAGTRLSELTSVHRVAVNLKAVALNKTFSFLYAHTLWELPSSSATASQLSTYACEVSRIMD